MGEIARALARGLSMVGFYALFGATFISATLPRGRRVALGGLIGASLALALLASAAWYLLQTQYFANASTWSDEWAALPVVALNTRFGMLLPGRCAALVLAALLWRAGARTPAAGLALGAVVGESWLGHGGAMTGAVGALLLVTSVAHLGAGAVWLGALPALWLALRRLPAADAVRLARRFSPIGIVCVTLLLVTAAIQYMILIWHPASLFTTAYGLSALVKMLLLAALTGIAAGNRALTRHLPARGPRLQANILAEIALGIAVLLAAGFITQFAPPAMTATVAPA